MKLNNYGSPMKPCDMRQCCQGICYLFEVDAQPHECPSFGIHVEIQGSKAVSVYRDTSYHNPNNFDGVKVSVK